MRLGFYMGLSDAALARKLEPNASWDQLFLLGPQLHQLRGMVKVVPHKLRWDSENNDFTLSSRIDSWEVEICRTTLGQLEEPACWVLLGYACAYTSRINQEVQYREVSCCDRVITVA